MNLRHTYQAPEGDVPSSAGIGTSVPENAPPAPAGEGSASEGVNWNDLVADDPPSDSTAEPLAAAAPPAAPTPKAPAAAPAAPAASAPAASPPASSPPPVAPGTPPAAVPGQPAGTVAEQEAALRTQLETELAGIYAGEISEDDAAQLVVDPVKVLPRLLAKATLDAVRLAMGQVHQALPGVIQRTTQQQAGSQQAWSSFYAAHGDLNKAELRPFVVNAIEAVKRLPVKPTSRDEVMAAVARTARAMAGLPDPAAPPAAPASSAPPVAPHTPVARGTAAPSAPSRSTDVWGDLVGNTPGT